LMMGSVAVRARHAGKCANARRRAAPTNTGQGDRWR